MVEASNVEHSKLRSRLLVAAGGSLRFGCQHPAPRHIRSRGHPFRFAAIDKKMSSEVYVQKERDSKPLVNNKSDIGKWPGLGPTIRISGSLQIGVSYWRDYNVVCMQQIYTCLLSAEGFEPRSFCTYTSNEYFLLTAAILKGCPLLRMCRGAGSWQPKRRLPPSAISNRLRNLQSGPPSMLLSYKGKK